MRAPGETEYRAKQLRRAMSPPELKLWFRLKARESDQPAFRRQHAIGPFIADFYCAKARLVVEVDGGGHSSDAAQRYDAGRDAYLRRQGLRVHRVLASSVFANPDFIAEELKAMARRLARQHR